ncbi:MAG TPA: leucine-rich repeat domain-containing protein [bacterium]|nr:leucine-rich repeat domain-containing protein [bacterium]
MRPISGIIATLLLLTACTGCDNNEEAFPDPAFKACVKNRLDQYSIIWDKKYSIENEKDLEIIEGIGCDGGGVFSVKGAEKLINVQELGLNSNQIESVEPLRHLKKLELLNISDNKLSNIEPLAEVSSLKNLNFMGNYVKDILSLVTLTGLQYLYTKANCITDQTQFETIQTAIPELKIRGEDEQDPSRCQ